MTTSEIRLQAFLLLHLSEIKKLCKADDEFDYDTIVEDIKTVLGRW